MISPKETEEKAYTRIIMRKKLYIFFILWCAAGYSGTTLLSDRGIALYKKVRRDMFNC